ncbi:SagB/ThcOx family dehydrogenase [Devosia nitrariae]|uniref:SagB-type dehydrogenase family enzyme n=1 Tax=Devosia nitrariae TaxID=2071872 RepID=A0ABQ5W258_9HYPH|nr:SagB family peptide dehydrogenase [Devosia nitrariae]GLQ53946.1 hypothetical protein GCM10010862_12050 [Devosia nitrariae]
MAVALTEPAGTIGQRAAALPEGLLRSLEAGPVAVADIDRDFETVLPEVYLALHILWQQRALTLLDRAIDPAIRVVCAIEDQPLNLGTAGLAASWRLSRFAFMRAGRDGRLRIETPRLPVVAEILRPELAGLFATLAEPQTVDGLADRIQWLEGREHVQVLLLLLQNAGVVEACDGNGRRPEDLRADLVQWEFHDLLFHSRSRKGRHSAAIGGDFRFRGQLPPQPALKANRWSVNSVMLPRPDIAALTLVDPPFSAVLESRRSIRDQDFDRPLSIGQLGEFLYRAARVRDRFQTDIGEFTSRPYPSGGASYELELYVTINVCIGLGRGFYYYDAAAHTLNLIQAANDEVEALLDEAWLSAARMCRPQVLITIASRFHRVTWKYSGMAYAAQLKNVGVLYQTLYLVATAMNLAGCALGLGNSERMCRLAGTNYFEEGSIGEFMLGTARETGTG